MSTAFLVAGLGRLLIAGFCSSGRFPLRRQLNAFHSRFTSWLCCSEFASVESETPDLEGIEDIQLLRNIWSMFMMMPFPLAQEQLCPSRDNDFHQIA
jgi:hypothetical protein